MAALLRLAKSGRTHLWRGLRRCAVLLDVDAARVVGVDDGPALDLAALQVHLQAESRRRGDDDGMAARWSTALAECGCSGCCVDSILSWSGMSRVKLHATIWHQMKEDGFFLIKHIDTHAKLFLLPSFHSKHTLADYRRRLVHMSDSACKNPYV